METLAGLGYCRRGGGGGSGHGGVFGKLCSARQALEDACQATRWLGVGGRRGASTGRRRHSENAICDVGIMELSVTGRSAEGHCMNEPISTPHGTKAAAEASHKRTLSCIWKGSVDKDEAAINENVKHQQIRSIEVSQQHQALTVDSHQQAGSIGFKAEERG